MIDFHNHHQFSAPDTLSIRSFHQKEQALFAEWKAPCSVGLHPCFVSAVEGIRDEQLNWLSRVAQDEKVLFIGECGLDKLQGPDLINQTFVFEYCMQLAETLRKPLVIHCVRAYAELLSIIKKLQPSIPLVIHGFARKPSVLEPLIKQGFFISFGAAILAPNSGAAQSLAQTPLDQLFLETDDKVLPIADLYTRAAQIKGLTFAALEAAIQSNWEQLGAIKK
ncbi:TatD family hydrolase [Haliscomenobacter hydrossis]|uniref:TatD family hydrolase n=1 Tax=Haliscomenobacter hydrossis TaxID=2350 RepID=UPI00145CFD42|nr:TatD family hydrolase [Haliscomenobacter hydrossis]